MSLHFEEIAVHFLILRKGPLIPHFEENIRWEPGTGTRNQERGIRKFLRKSVPYLRNRVNSITQLFMKIAFTHSEEARFEESIRWKTQFEETSR